ncbi:Complex I intermediate-associated protein-like protein CIA30 [Apiospora sp. TS-2023a]
MRATPGLLYKGFFGRSLDEFKRLSNIALKMEGIKGPSGPMPLHTFDNPQDVADCKLMCDVDIGGYSKASLDWVPAAQQPQSSLSDSPAAKPRRQHTSTPAHVRFQGSISTALPAHRPDIQRSGFAAWRTIDRPPTVFGRAVWDIDMYTYLALRVKSDGRAYFVNVQTESVVPSDLHQHRLFARRPGEWETVLVKWNDFVRTNHGFVVEPQTEMLRQKVKSVGIGLTDRVPGPFELCIQSMWATNDPNEADSQEEESQAASDGEGQLKTKSGKNIKWSED